MKDHQVKCAAIFDMDGVMVDNAAAHHKAWSFFCQQHHRPLKKGDWDRIVGHTNEKILHTLFGPTISLDQVKQYTQEKEALYRNIYRTTFKPIRGLNAFLRFLEKQNVRLAIASSAPMVNIRFVLRHPKIHARQIRTIVTAEDVRYAKPHPAMYQTAARRLGVRPQECVVFEDSLIGIESAQRAGMMVVALSTTYPRHKLRHADMIVDNFTDKRLHRLFE